MSTDTRAERVCPPRRAAGGGGAPGSPSQMIHPGSITQDLGAAFEAARGLRCNVSIGQDPPAAGRAAEENSKGSKLMLKGTAIWVLGAAGVACLAIGVGVFTNHRDEMSPLAPTVSEHVATTDVDFSSAAWTEPDVVATEQHANELAAAEPATTGLESSEDVEAAESTEGMDEAAIDQAIVIEGDPLEVARTAFVNRDYPMVIAALQGAASENDARFDVHYLLGLALRYEGRADEAVAAMDAALAIQPNSVRALTNSARALLETRDLAQAEERVRRAVELSPDDPGAWNVLGRVHLTNGALAEAEDAFTRVLEIQPEHAWALNNLGFARLQRGAWEDAAEVLERAILARADVAVFHNNLGVVYERLSRLSDAQRAYAEALTLQSDYAKAEVSLARVTDRIAEGATDIAAGEAEPTVAAVNTNSVEASDPTVVETSRVEKSGGPASGVEASDDEKTSETEADKSNTEGESEESPESESSVQP